jgi:signal peptidase
MGLHSWVKAKAPRLHHFLTRKDRPYPALREAVAGAFVFLILLGGLYAFTGQPIAGGYPVVVVTSGSMMHCANAGLDGTGPPLGRDCKPQSYGRLGTIDPGDLVFVRHITDRDDVSTLAQGFPVRYGRVGDVVVYRPSGSTGATPIIHRALFYLQINEDATYSIPELNISHEASLDQPKITFLTHCVLQGGLHGPWTSADSGFITKGDNNPMADQCPQAHLSDPARPDWVLGKARGEVPWFGLIKLFVDDLRHNSHNFSHAGDDSKVMLIASLCALVALPYATQATRRAMRRRRSINGPPETPPPTS